MQRKSTKTTRGANADEKAFQAWLKHRDCSVCGHPAPSIVHHCEGATFKHNKTLIGHWFCIPLCQSCDDVVTHQSRKVFRERFGKDLNRWVNEVNDFHATTCKIPEPQVTDAIEDWNR